MESARNFFKHICIKYNWVPRDQSRLNQIPLSDAVIVHSNVNKVNVDKKGFLSLTSLISYPDANTVSFTKYLCCCRFFQTFQGLVSCVGSIGGLSFSLSVYIYIYIYISTHILTVYYSPIPLFIVGIGESS